MWWKDSVASQATQDPKGFPKPLGSTMPGAPGGTRTHSLLIRSQRLYPLSYGRTPDIVTRHPVVVNQPDGVL